MGFQVNDRISLEGTVTKPQCGTGGLWTEIRLPAGYIKVNPDELTLIERPKPPPSAGQRAYEKMRSFEPKIWLAWDMLTESMQAKWEEIAQAANTPPEN